MQTDREGKDSKPSAFGGENAGKEALIKFKEILVIAGMLAVTTVVNIFLEHIIQPSSLVFVYLVPTIAAVIYFGTWAAVLSFTAGFLIFNFGFVEPYYSLHISNPQDIYNVVVYFSIAGLITYLINRVRRQNIFLSDRLDRVSLIEEMTREYLLLTPIEETTLDGGLAETLRARVFAQLGQLAVKYIRTSLEAPALVFFREDDGRLKLWAKNGLDQEITEKENDAASWTLTNGDVSGAGTLTQTDTPYYFIPLKSLEGVIGVIGVLGDSRNLFPEQRRLLGTIANLTTIVACGWMRLKFRKNG